MVLCLGWGRSRKTSRALLSQECSKLNSDVGGSVTYKSGCFSFALGRKPILTCFPPHYKNRTNKQKKTQDTKQEYSTHFPLLQGHGCLRSLLCPFSQQAGNEGVPKPLRSSLTQWQAGEVDQYPSSLANLGWHGSEMSAPQGHPEFLSRTEPKLGFSSYLFSKAPSLPCVTSPFLPGVFWDCFSNKFFAYEFF